MKKSFILLTMLLVLPLATVGTMAAKKLKTVTWNETKAVYNTTRNVLEVTKVELCDTATTVSFHVTFRPGAWIRISSGCFLQDEQKRHYTLRGAEGIAFDTKFDLPDTGETDFTLRFNPMPKDTKMITFREGEKEGDWQVFGIHDAKTVPDLSIPKGLKEKTTAANETLPATAYAPGKVKITCKVYGYQPEMKLSMAEPVFTLSGKTVTARQVPLADDGTVTLEASVDAPTFLQIGLPPYRMSQIYVVPGSEISCAMDLSEDNGSGLFDFSGPLARTNYEMNRKTTDIKKRITANYSQMTEGMEGLTPDECAAFLNKTLAAQKEEINATKFCDATKQLLRMLAEEKSMEWRYSFRNKWEDTKYQLVKETIKTEDDYMAFMKTLNTPAVKGDLTTDMPDMECLNSPQALFNRVLPVFSAAGKVLPISNSLNRDIARTYGFVKGSLKMDEAAEAQITEPYLKEIIAEKRADDKRMEEELAKNGNVFFNAYDDVKPEDMLPTILKKYEGKAVFIDVWATWCGPCKAGHKQMVPLKEEMKGKDVVFVYITSPTSPANTWKSMITEIPGEHYYLTKEQYGYLMNMFESQGIPTYALFDKQGKLTYKSTGFAGNDKFREEIEKAMK